MLVYLILLAVCIWTINVSNSPCPFLSHLCPVTLTLYEQWLRVGARPAALWLLL